MKTKNIAGLFVLLLIGAILTTPAIAVSGKPISVAVCTSQQLIDNQGVCRIDSPFVKSPAIDIIGCDGYCNWLYSIQEIIDATKVLFVTMGSTELNCPCILLGVQDIGNIKTLTNNETHMETEEIDRIADNFDHSIVYEETTPIAYNELGFEYEQQTITYFNGTDNVTEDINVSFINDFITFEDNEIAVNTNEVPSADAPATLVWEGITREPNTIYKDGVICSASECTGRVYNANTDTYEFVTQGFSEFTLGFLYDQNDIVPATGDAVVKGLRGVGFMATIIGIALAVGLGVAMIKWAGKR